MIKTRNDLNAFESASDYSGARTKLIVPAGTEVRGIGVDMNDPLYGEPVTWFEAKIDGAWKTVGAINLPVLKRGWKREIFEKVEA